MPAESRHNYTNANNKIVRPKCDFLLHLKDSSHKQGSLSRNLTMCHCYLLRQDLRRRHRVIRTLLSADTEVAVDNSLH